VIVESQLPDGTNVLIWPLLPEDRAAVRAAYEQLSEETRNSRFLASVPHLTESMLDHLVDDVDGVDHVALALVVVGEDHVGVPTAIGRVIRYPDDPTAADVAVTVADEWQGRGIATVLIAELMRQRPRGVTRIVTTVSAENHASLALLRRLGPVEVTPDDAGHLDVTVELGPAFATDVAEPSASS
jgi:RimJ/RimL family protein N-acetyltransferase